MIIRMQLVPTASSFLRASIRPSASDAIAGTDSTSIDEPVGQGVAAVESSNAVIESASAPVVEMESVLPVRSLGESAEAPGRDITMKSESPTKDNEKPPTPG